MAAPTPRFPTPANARPAGNQVSHGEPSQARASDGQPSDGDASDGGVVEVNAACDLTEREAIPPLWHGRTGSVSAPVPSSSSSSSASSHLPLAPAVVRSRRQTLVSPIPALLAAQMGDIAEDQSDSTPLPIELRQEATSRFDIAAQRALLTSDELESEYVVELVPPEKPE